MYDPVANKVHITRDVIFEELRPWSWEGDYDETTSMRHGSFTVTCVTESGDILHDSGTHAGLVASDAKHSWLGAAHTGIAGTLHSCTSRERNCVGHAAHA